MRMIGIIVYGSDASKIQKMIEKEPSFAEKLYEGYTFTAAHVVWAAREEFAQNIEDVLARPGEDAISGCPCCS